MTPSERERLCGDHECDRPYWRERAERAEAAARELHAAAREVLATHDDWLRAIQDAGSLAEAHDREGRAWTALRDALAHPSFSGEEGTGG